LLYFLIYLFIEVMVSSSFSSSIGGLGTFFEIIISALAGIGILANFKISFIESILRFKDAQITKQEFIQENVGRALGAILLVIPGFFTDIIGLLLQFSLFITLFSKIFATQADDSNFQTYHKTKGETNEIIDVEIIDDSKSIK